MVETMLKIGRVIRIDKKHSSSRERNGKIDQRKERFLCEPWFRNKSWLLIN